MDKYFQSGPLRPYLLRACCSTHVIYDDDFDSNMMYREDPLPIDDEMHKIGMVMPDSSDGLRKYWQI